MKNLLSKFLGNSTFPGGISPGTMPGIITCRAKNRLQLDTYGRRAFAVIGPTLWNALDNNLRDPEFSIASYGRPLKTHLFQQHSAH